MDDAGKFETTEFLHHLIQGMAEGVIFVDENEIIRLCNPVGGAIRGVKGEEIIGKHLLDCHPKATHKKVLEIIEGLRNGKKKEVKRTVRLRGGFYEHTYAAVRDGKGRFLGVVSVSRDITGRELLEKELKEHAKKLERSNRMKELFTDIISHDLINPAAIIANYADMLLEESPTGEVTEAFQNVKRNANRLIEMIETAGKYSKLEDLESLTFQEMDLGKVMKQMINEFQSLLNEKKIKIAHRLEGQYFAEVNPVIEDVFSNLISNAVKYSPPRSIISVDIVGEGKNWRVSVADQGEKIPQEYRRSIFERFRRVGKGSVKGSGLGLAIVKRAVELHEGNVWVEDNPEGGNIFYVDLPKRHKKGS